MNINRNGFGLEHKVCSYACFRKNIVIPHFMEQSIKKENFAGEISSSMGFNQPTASFNLANNKWENGRYLHLSQK